MDVADDNDTHFPVLGEEFERSTGVQPVKVGNTECRLVSAQALVRFATPRLTELLDTISTSELDERSLGSHSNTRLG